MNIMENYTMVLLYTLYSRPYLLYSISPVRRMEWKETARWIKFEEDVEEGGNKWSKPHVATLSLHSLFELRSCIFRGTVMLDVLADNLVTISGNRCWLIGG